MTSSPGKRVAVVYPAPAGLGGLGQQAATVIAALVRGGHEVVALGPGCVDTWPIRDVKAQVRWLTGAPAVPASLMRFSPLRLLPGAHTSLSHGLLGRWAAAQLESVRPDLVYSFTQVALEPLLWCRAQGVPSILDNPNGGIANFRQVCVDEWRAWCRGTYRDHPTARMVQRVQREYSLAQRVRVSSTWAASSTAKELTSPEKISVVDQPIDLGRFRPPATRERSSTLELVFVGSIDVRKGVLHLLRAVRALGSSVHVTLVGGTGSRPMHRALQREAEGLSVTVAPGDPVGAYQRADLAVLPSLEDGFGFVIAEAMACGTPCLVTDQCGSAEWVEQARAGWVVPAGSAHALSEALRDVQLERDELTEMGQRARAYVEQRAGTRCSDALLSLVDEVLAERGGSRARPTRA